MKTGTEAIQIIDGIAASRLPLSTRIIRLFALSQIYYRQTAGAHAAARLRELVGEETQLAFYVIYGLCGMPIPAADWIRAVPELNQ